MDEKQYITPEKAPVSKESSGFMELVKYAIFAAIIVIPFRIFIAQPYIVEGSSMDPTLKNGDYLIVDQISYKFEAPGRGDVIVMRYPKDTSKFFVKRMIAFPGEKVVIKKGKVTIFNTENPQGMTLDDSYILYPKNEEDFSTTLGDSEYFVMGDNRAASFDSRSWGPLPKEDLVGRPLLRLFPITKIGIWPGKK